MAYLAAPNYQMGSGKSAKPMSPAELMRMIGFKQHLDSTPEDRRAEAMEIFDRARKRGMITGIA